jgi:hypothetical protein
MFRTKTNRILKKNQNLNFFGGTNGSAIFFNIVRKNAAIRQEGGPLVDFSCWFLYNALCINLWVCITIHTQAHRISFMGMAYAVSDHDAATDVARP